MDELVACKVLTQRRRQEAWKHSGTPQRRYPGRRCIGDQQMPCSKDVAAVCHRVTQLFGHETIQPLQAPS